MSAKTDSLNKVKFDEENQPGISNLISILAKIKDEKIESIEKRFEGKGYGEFKREVADAVCELLKQIQTRFEEFNQKEILDEILSKGAKRAKRTAKQTLLKTTRALGLN